MKTGDVYMCIAIFKLYRLEKNNCIFVFYVYEKMIIHLSLFTKPDGILLFSNIELQKDQELFYISKW